MGFRKNPKEVINDHSNDSADDLDREEPGESEDEEVKRADGHLDRDEQIVTGGLSGADRIPKVQERKKKDMHESCGV